MEVEANIVVIFDGSGGQGPVDATGHFDFPDACGFRVIGDIDQTGHASGTGTQQGPCGCVTTIFWFGDRVP